VSNKARKKPPRVGDIFQRSHFQSKQWLLHGYPCSIGKCTVTLGFQEVFNETENDASNMMRITKTAAATAH
jgi:hypothetical protein